MGLPRVQFTVRRMMTLVAVVAVLIWLAMSALAFLAVVFDDTYYPARKTITRSWDAGPVPRVEVDVFAGYLNVVQSTDGQVSAAITTSGAYKHSQASADAAVNGVVISAIQDGGAIRIRATNPRKLRAYQLRTDVELRVPPEASVELLTGHGYIHIGQYLGGPNGNEWTSAPVALKSVKARDLGGVFTGMEAEIVRRPSSPATDVDLESRCGSIRIKGNHLLIKAKAEGGGIEYAGRLAPGLHSFATGPFAEHADGNWRLERGIRLVLPADTAFEIDAVSARSRVTSAFPLTFTKSRQGGVLAGKVGMAPDVKIDLRSDDGPIEILQSPPPTASSIRPPSSPT